MLTRYRIETDVVTWLGVGSEESRIKVTIEVSGSGGGAT